MGSEVQDREFARHVENRQAMGDLAAGLLAGEPVVSCAQARNPAHRATDCRPHDWDPSRDDHPDRGDPRGPWVCGICHPPLPGAEVERRYA